jgi:shikimate 5-dehydrogenase
MGAGGSAIAMTWYLTLSDGVRGTANRPSHIVVSNRSQPRLAEIARIHAEAGVDVPIDYVLAPKQTDNDAILNQLKPGSLVVNATGLGKDAPGSPISYNGQFPERGIVWELNYRGQLVFLNQARASADTTGPSDRRWLDIFYPWMDPCDRRSVPYHHSSERADF